MKKLIAIITLTLSPVLFAADLGSLALNYVPKGTVQLVKKDEVKVKTPNSTIVEIEFTKDNEFEEASGNIIEKDSFTPGEGLKNLSDIVTIVKEKGHVLQGDWSYDKPFMGPWQYEVDTFLDGREAELTIDAKSGAIVKTEFDD